MNIQRRHTFWGTFLVFFLSSTLVISLALGAFYQVDYRYRVKATTTSERLQVALGHKLTDTLLQDVIRDLRILEHSPVVISYLEAPDASNRQQVEALFLTMIQHKDSYDQIRFLDHNGIERIRVNQSNGTGYVTPLSKLQDKSQRYYFSDTFKLSNNKVFISPIDLNIENSQVELPPKPMIRVGTPVFDKTGHKVGILLINYLAAHLLNDIREVMAGTLGHVDLINSDGYWILSHDAEQEWGFMFGKKTTFADIFPDAWDLIRASDTGQVVLNNELYTWQTIYVLLANTVSSTGSGKAKGKSKAVVTDKDYYWKLLTHIPQDVYALQIRENLIAISVLFATLVVLSAIVSAVFTRYRIREKHFIHELASSEQRQKAINECLAEGVIIVDRNGKISATNPESVRLLECSEGDLLTKTLTRELQLLTNDSAFNKIMEQGEVFHVEETTFHKCKGGEISVAFTASPLIVDGATEGIIIAFEDISQRKQLKDQLKFMASHDELTGLYNRREISNVLEQAFNKASRYQRPLSICMFDLDYFKKINDEHGHQTGDKVLQKVGKLLTGSCRRADAPGRYGGEEFIVILPETGLSGAEKWAESMRMKVNLLNVKPESNAPRLNLTISCGVAVFNESMTHPGELIAAADQALYRAKDSGRNKICIN